MNTLLPFFHYKASRTEHSLQAVRRDGHNGPPSRTLVDTFGYCWLVEKRRNRLVSSATSRQGYTKIARQVLFWAWMWDVTAQERATEGEVGIAIG
jgi:hypothetical protein